MILAVESQEWKFQIGDLLSIMLDLFGDLSIEEIEDMERPYLYQWQSNGGSISGFVHRSLNTIYFDGDFNKIVRLVLKLIPLIPPTYSTYFFDQSYTHHIEVNESTTVSDIQNVFKVIS